MFNHNNTSNKRVTENRKKSMKNTKVHIKKRKTA
nr:MAG TPA: hypothetical protein [Caudoviricetes sp.]